MTKCKYFLTSTLFVFLVSLSVSLYAVKPKNSTQAKTSASKASPAPGSDHPISDPEEFGLFFIILKRKPQRILRNWVKS
jgi:hypothetical protein